MTQPGETQELKHQTVGMQIVNNWHSGNYADLIAAIDNALDQRVSDTRAPVDSQGAGDATAIDYSSALKFVNEWLWNPPAFGSADRSTDQMPWHDPYKQDAAQMVIAASNRAATQMRTAYVEKVKEIAARYNREQFAEAGNQRIVEKTRLDTANAIAVELSSLTLDQVKQKEQSK